MVEFLGFQFGRVKEPIQETAIQENSAIPTIQMSDMANFVGGVSSSFNGDKFLGGFGVTKDYEIIDYWLLRKRSKQLFTENLYARGIIRRLITNEINAGLSLEATPDGAILGLTLEELDKWAENTERRFNIWGKNPQICDYKGLRTFGALQRQARMMALVSGDVLVVLRQGITKLPTIELIDASSIVTPDSDVFHHTAKAKGYTIRDGVELDKDGKHVAFYVLNDDGKYTRVSAYGEKTGRKQAWLLYGTERLINDVRGQSILALVIQSLKEVDRYRDAEQRAAVINATIALWIQKTEDKIGSLPITGGAVRRDTVTTQNDSQGRKDVQFSANMPGMILQELQQGESPVSYDTRRPNVNFAVFEGAIINGIAWAVEIPPEVLTLGFQNNYSASRGAVNEFKMYLERIRTGIGEELCAPIYEDFVLSETLKGGIDTPQLLQAWNNLSKWDIYGAWMQSDWAGAIKPNVDLLKEVRAYKALTEEGWITRDRAARELTGMKFSKVVQQLNRENEQLGNALQPLIDRGLIKDENTLPEPYDENEQIDKEEEN